MTDITKANSTDLWMIGKGTYLMGLIDDIRADREAGTPGPWEPQSASIYSEHRESQTGNSRGCLAILIQHHENDWVNVHDARRIARVPDMEAALLAAEELADSISRSDAWEDIDRAMVAYRKATGAA